MKLAITTALAAVLAVHASPIRAQQHVWFVPPASNEVQQGFVRVTNRGAQAVNVPIYGYDDRGMRSGTAMSFSLAPGESKQFNSHDLEYGNPAKGLSGAIGDYGVGSWYLWLDTPPAAPIEVTSFIRTRDGFLTSVQDSDAGKFPVSTSFTVPMFNPAVNVNQVSVLRMVNAHHQEAIVSIVGHDDAGTRAPVGTGTLTIRIAPWHAVQLTAAELEQGAAAKGLNGALGVGSGKWRLAVGSSRPIKVMSLLQDPNGYITEIPVTGADPQRVGYFVCTDFNGAMVYSQDAGEPVYLGFIGSRYALDSINNASGRYGSASSTTSVRNPYGTYGSPSSSLSAANPNAGSPPVVVKNGKVIARLHNGGLYANAVSLASLDYYCSGSLLANQRDAWTQ